MHAMKKWTAPLWLAMGLAAAWVLIERLQTVDFAEVRAQLLSLPPQVMLAGLALSAVIYALVAFYEGVAAHMVTGRRMMALAARNALIANPLSRAVGVPMVSGAALRYRLYAEEKLTAVQIAAMMALTSMPYFFSVGWMVDISLLLNAEQAARTLRLSVPVILTLGAAGLAKDFIWLAVLALRRQPLRAFGRELRLPTLAQGGVQLAVGITQLCCMTGILYLFMPSSLDMSWPAFIAVYCIAFIAGQLSNVPAGLGVLEAALMLMLPQVPPAQLLGAVLAYRAMFELLPMLLAALMLLVFESTHPAGMIRQRLAQRRLP